MRALIVVFFFALPFSVSAATLAELQAQVQALMTQIAALQSQTQTNTVITTAPVSSGAATPASCPNLSRNLSRGMKGSDVSQLQQFLISQNLLSSDSATGFYGALTESAVKKFQCTNMNICTGSPSANGYGVVGAKTRAAIANKCRIVITQPSQPVPPPISIPPTPTNPDVPPINLPNQLTCTPLTSQTQNIACPIGQTGSITQTRTSSCAAGAIVPVWGEWITSTTQCTNVRAPHSEMVTIAHAHMKNNFWIGSAVSGHIAPTTNGIPNPPPTDRPKGDLWQAATYLNVLYTDYIHRHSTESKDMITSEWNHIRNTFSVTELTSCGLPGTTQLWGIDDAGWVSTMFLQIHQVTQDPEALSYAKEIVRCSHRVWWDEVWGGGFWYSDTHSAGKSLIQIRLALNSLEIYEKTGEVEFLHIFQFSYSWIERNLLRSDGLYWMDFRDGVVYGLGAPPSYIFNDSGSVTSIAGDMGMAVAHTRYLRMTNDQNYVARIERTVSGILDQLVRDSIFVNDRDPQADGIFVREFVTEVLPVISPALQQRAKNVLKETARAIHERSRTSAGFYGPNFGSAPTAVASPWIRAGFVPESIMVNANTIDFLYGAFIVN